MTCENIDAGEAKSIGLVNKVVPDKDLMDSCHAFIEKIAKRKPLTIQDHQENCQRSIHVQDGGSVPL